MLDNNGLCPDRTIGNCLIEINGLCYECTYTGAYVSSDRSTCLDGPGYSFTLYCSKVDVNGNCVLCNIGYQLSGGQCVLKPDECMIYNINGKCDQCVFSPIKDGMCLCIILI